MAERMVWVENMTRASVTIVVRNSNFKRTLKGEGAKVSIPFDILYNGLSEPGIDVMIQKGYIRIIEKQDRIDLGLEMEEDTANTDTVTLGRKEMLQILTENNPVEIKATLENLAETQRIKFANVAAENGIYSPGIAKLIKDYTGMDLLKVMTDVNSEKEDKN